MSLVTGIGDEIIGVTIACLLSLIVTIVWRSTRVRERSNVSFFTFRLVDTATNSNSVNSSNVTNDEAVVAAAAETVSTDETPLPAEISLGAIEEDPLDDAECVTIRIRFIDETQFEVRSPLSHTLSQFKSRHLKPRRDVTGATEAAFPIQPNDRVRLIFNGKVLQSETSSLAQLGLQHNSTVHCLVQRNAAPVGGPDHAVGGRGDLHTGPGADLDLSNLCYPLLGTVLFVIWWCQVVYSHYFTFTSTMSLVSLTFLYAASITNAYLNH